MSELPRSLVLVFADRYFVDSGRGRGTTWRRLIVARSWRSCRLHIGSPVSQGPCSVVRKRQQNICHDADGSQSVNITSENPLTSPMCSKTTMTTPIWWWDFLISSGHLPPHKSERQARYDDDDNNNRVAVISDMILSSHWHWFTHCSLCGDACPLSCVSADACLTGWPNAQGRRDEGS